MSGVLSLPTVFQEIKGEGVAVNRGLCAYLDKYGNVLGHPY